MIICCNNQKKNVAPFILEQAKFDILFASLQHIDLQIIKLKTFFLKKIYSFLLSKLPKTKKYLIAILNMVLQDRNSKLESFNLCGKKNVARIGSALRVLQQGLIQKKRIIRNITIILSRNIKGFFINEFYIPRRKKK